MKDTPSESLRLDSFDTDKPVLGDKLQEALGNIRVNRKAGYTIDMAWLKNEGYSDTLINGMLESGLLVSMPKGGYDIA